MYKLQNKMHSVYFVKIKAFLMVFIGSKVIKSKGKQIIAVLTCEWITKLPISKKGIFSLKGADTSA